MLRTRTGTDVASTSKEADRKTFDRFCDRLSLSDCKRALPAPTGYAFGREASSNLRDQIQMGMKHYIQNELKLSINIVA